MIKEIVLKGIRRNINKITLDDMVDFIENEHPEDKKKFASLVFNKIDKTYNHFKAQRIFLGLYFPEMVERQEKITASDKIKEWLLLEEQK